MSTDFIGLFDRNRADVTMEWLHEKLAADPIEISQTVSQYKDLWNVDCWYIDHSGDRDALVGPGGFAIRFNAHTVELYHMMPFYCFAGSERERHMLRDACAFLAKLFGSQRAIYTHELMPYEGDSLQDIENSLRVQIGPPAKDFTELHAAELYGPRAWYVDTFSDFSSIVPNEISN